MKCFSPAAEQLLNENIDHIFCSSLFSEDVTSVWDFEHSVEQYQAEGGTALSSLTSQIEKARKFLERYSVSK
ncbi:hypothetical protein SK128_025431, partial [Halocaridina rubra]